MRRSSYPVVLADIPVDASSTVQFNTILLADSFRYYSTQIQYIAIRDSLFSRVLSWVGVQHTLVYINTSDNLMTEFGTARCRPRCRPIRSYDHYHKTE